MKRMHSDSEVKRLAKQALNPAIEQIEGDISAISSTGLKREIVETLPTGSDIKTNVIYMILDPNASSGNVYNEYMYINSNWELIGTTATVTNEVTGNPTIPSGATPAELEALKIGTNYFKIDKPVHFVQLSSLSITTAKRDEIVSLDYFVIIKYDGQYYYEYKIESTYKRFKTIPTPTNSGTDGYDRKIGTTYEYLIVYFNSLYASHNTSTFSTSDAAGKNINAGYINSKSDSNTNVAGGKVLVADGHGNVSWEMLTSFTNENDNTNDYCNIVINEDAVYITCWNETDNNTVGLKLSKNGLQYYSEPFPVNITPETLGYKMYIGWTDAQDRTNTLDKLNYIIQNYTYERIVNFLGYFDNCNIAYVDVANSQLYIGSCFLDVSQLVAKGMSEIPFSLSDIKLNFYDAINSTYKSIPIDNTNIAKLVIFGYTRVGDYHIDIDDYFK